MTINDAAELLGVAFGSGLLLGLIAALSRGRG